MKMKKLLYILPLIAYLWGCASSIDYVLVDYEKVNLNDGVSAEEALLIGQKRIYDRKLYNQYVMDKPKLLTDFETLKSSDTDKYWFVAFTETRDPQLDVYYLMLIQKTDGKIIFSRSYNPESEWILEAFFLRQNQK